MAGYGIVYPTFWTGRTGRILAREAKKERVSRDAQVVAMYLCSSPHATMIGLYYLPLLYIVEEVGMARPEAMRALTRLAAEDIRFAFYDYASEHVWIPEMAVYRLDDELKESDHRVKWVNRLYGGLAENPFLGEFFDRYAGAFHLSGRRGLEAPSKPLDSPLEAPSKGGSGDYVTVTVPVTDPISEKRGKEAVLVEWIVEEWNRIEGVSKVRKVEPGMGIEAVLQRRVRLYGSKDWWSDLFNLVRGSDFLCGRKTDFRATLDWTLGPKNLGKIMAGNYENRPGRQGITAGISKRIQELKERGS